MPVAEDDKFEIMETLASQCNFAGGSTCSLDGLRVEYENGWGLIRASNTTPNLTLRFEAENDVELEIIKQRFYVEELRPFINQHRRLYLIMSLSRKEAVNNRSSNFSSTPLHPEIRW